MDRPQKQLPLREHARNKSIPQATRPRSTTKGPLEVDDVSLSSPRLPDPNMSFLSPEQSSSPRATSPNPRSPRSPGRSPAPSPRLGPPPKKDFSFLLRPEIYHTLSPTTIPQPFRDSPHQPDPEAPIADLVARGHYRPAAVAAVQQLTGTAGHTPPSPEDHVRIFSLLHTRLACLTLIEATNIAAQEVKALEDVQSPFYLANTVPTTAPSVITSPTTSIGLGIDAIAAGPPPHSPSPSFLAAQQQDPPDHLVPWELRVLAVRLQSLGFGDPRRSVMSYYELAREARARLARATANHDNSARELWRGRLAELGLRVAGALVEMDDLSGAAAHLASLPVVQNGTSRLATARALLWLHLGDVDAARACVNAGREGGPSFAPDSSRDKVISALCDMADGDYESALATWTDLREELPRDEMVGVNTAVCLLYVGRMEQGRAILEEMVDSGHSSHTLLFNLTTMYELCTERAKDEKQRLAERVAALEPSLKGWEKTNADFKL
ncbi:hypothetical protein RB601_007828 [Gaeumannomyces tritici]